jgi:hypothetical protein
MDAPWAGDRGLGSNPYGNRYQHEQGENEVPRHAFIMPRPSEAKSETASGDAR